MQRTLLLIATLGVCLPARSQPTISHADLDGRLAFDGTVSQFTSGSSAAAAAIAADTGPNRTWDFTAVSFTASTVSEVMPVTAPTPCPDLDSATDIVRYEVTNVDSLLYFYHTLTASEFRHLGVCFVVNGSVVGELKSVPSELSGVIPLTASSSWESSYELQIIPATGFATTVEETSEVVGWGTLITPAANVDALAIRTRSITTTTIGPTSFVDSTFNISYATGQGPVATISLDGKGAVTSADYFAYSTNTAVDPATDGRSAFHFEGIYPNPIGRESVATLDFGLLHPADVRLEVFDALGRRVALLSDGLRVAGSHRVQWTPGKIPSGVYLIRITAGPETATRMLTVTSRR